MTPAPSEARATADHVGMPEQAGDDVPVLEHAYDGIREYDNPLPRWWRLGFWASCRSRRRLPRVVPRRRLGDDAGRALSSAKLAAYQSQRAAREAED